jgi:hypothetical protein
MPQSRRAPPLTSVGEVDTFIDLLRLAREDPRVHAALEQLLSLEPARRQVLVHNWVGDLLVREAPRAFTQAIACLMDDAIAEQARTVILGKRHGAHPARG